MNDSLSDLNLNVSNCLTLEEWKQLNKEISYKLYLELALKLQRKETFIEDVIIGMKKKLETAPTQHMATGLADVSTGSGQPSSSESGLFKEQVREFKPMTLKENQDNCVFGSSLIAKLEDDATIPLDVAIHAYRGSTTQEKIRVLDNYESKKLKTLILQDGTNSISKSARTAQQLFLDYVELIEKCKEKFNPDVFVLCKVPPFQEIPRNQDKNDKIPDFNNLIAQKYGDGMENCKILKLNEIIRAVPTYNDQITHFNQLYYDNVHFNYKLGIPFLKNILLGYLLKTSNGAIDFSKISNNPRYKMQSKFSNYQQRFFNSAPRKNYHQQFSNQNFNPSRYKPY